MFNWFKKKNKKAHKELPKTVNLKPINYPAKIILAWAKAVEGDPKFSLWLKENGYEELYRATKAIYLQDEHRDWLMENGYAHLLAMINAAEGNKIAQKWLQKNKMDLLYHISMAVEGNDESWIWLRKNATQDLFILAQTIKKIKDQIEEAHNDIHKFGKDF